MHGILDCPSCMSRDIIDECVGESHCWGHDYEHYEMRCMECGAEWMLHYEDGDWVVEGDRDYEEG